MILGNSSVDLTGICFFLYGLSTIHDLDEEVKRDSHESRLWRGHVE